MLKNLFLDTAGLTFGHVRAYNRKKRSARNKQPWFGTMCKQLRRKYHEAKTLYAKNKNIDNKMQLINASKSYKKWIFKAFSQHKFKKEKEMRQLRSDNPKDFYKILKNKERPNSNSPSTDEFFNYFSHLNKGEPNNDDVFDFNMDEVLNVVTDNDIINEKITENEIMQAISQLKLNKSAGVDRIINEYIKSTSTLLIPVYVKLFNTIFDNGVFPEEWHTGIIIPIFKNKGSRLNPENYRPITLLCCCSKLFTTLLNNRLNKFIEENNIISEAQTAFRKGYSTTDHIFTLHHLIDILKKRKKKLYCAFVDFEKAFDMVPRTLLWYKLLQNNINGKFFRIIYEMYQGLKSIILVNNKQSALFPCNIGIRQGENLSPILFSLYLNDIEDYLTNHGCQGVAPMSDNQNSPLDIVLHMFCLLYADDTALLSTSANDLQHTLNIFYQYSLKWKFKINCSKTKILIFNGTTRDYKHIFKIGNTVLENVKEYKYLGIIFTKLNNFRITKTKLSQQATKAMYFVLSKAKDNHLSTECKLKMFDSIVLPILLYGCEVWGYEKIDIFNSVQINF